MRISKFLSACIGVSLLLLGMSARAAYPEHAITMVVNYPAGGPLDLLARSIAAYAGKALKQPVVVENKSGAAGTIGARNVARAQADGYTLLLSVDTIATVNPYVYAQSDFDVNKVMAPITMAGTFNQALVTRKDLGVTTLADFIELARKKDLTYASAGIGSPGHLTMTEFAQALDLPLTHVPYKGNAPATSDLLGARVDAGFLVIGGVAQYVDAGRLIPLAVSGSEPDPLLPGIPTIAGSGLPGLDHFNVGFGFVLMAPKGTPGDIQALWSKLVADAFASPELRERLKSLDLLPTHTNPDETRAYLAKEGTKWKAVVEKAGIRIE